MLRVVLDTNVIISGTIMDYGAPSQILKSWQRGDFVLVVSQPILQEIDRVFHYPRIKYRRHLTERDIETVLHTLQKYGLNTPAEMEIKVVPEDPEDNKLIIAAVEGEADYIVSGDWHLRNLKSYRGIRIISPSEFVRILGLRDDME